MRLPAPCSQLSPSSSSLPTPYCLLPTSYCLLLTPYSLLLTAYSLHSPDWGRQSRKPRLMLVSSGTNPERLADRTHPGLPFQLPPRSTRREPPEVITGLFRECRL